jgi:MFS family permease
MLAASVAAYVIFASEPSSLHLERVGQFIDEQPLRVLGRIARFVESFANWDFAAAFSARALVFLSQYVVSGYLLYALQDYVGSSGLPGGSAEVATGLFNTIRTIASVASLVATGWVLQRTELRRAFFVAYSILMAIGMAWAAISPSWAAMVGFAVLSGVAWGIFASVDLAIVSHVLPSRRSAGRDIGILAVASALPQLIAPGLGAAVIATFGYPWLFALGAALTISSGLVAMQLRSVR